MTALPRVTWAVAPVALAFAAVAAGLAIAMPADVPLASGTIALGGVAWVAFLFLRGDLQPVRAELLIPAVLFSTACLASAFWAERPDPFTVHLALAPVATAIVCGLLTTSAVRRVAVDVMVAVLGLLGLASVVIKLTGRQTGVALAEGGELTQRIFPGAFGHPNQFAAVLVMLIPFAGVRLLHGRGRRRVLAAVPLVLGLIALFLTYSRGFWAASAVSCVLLAGSRRERLLVLGAGGAVAALFAGTVADRVLSSDTVNNSRLEFWGDALSVIVHHPLNGVGLLNFPYHVGSVLPDTADAPPHAHDLVLITATEIGVPGALALFVALGVLAWRLVHSRPGRLTPDDRMARSATLAAFAAVAVGGITDGVVYHNVQTLMVAASVVGMAAALTRWPETTPAPTIPVEAPATPPPVARRGAVASDPPAPGNLQPVARNFVLMASSTMATRVLTFTLGLVLARHLGAGDYGLYALGAAVAVVISAVTSVGLDPYVTREVARDRAGLHRNLRRLLAARFSLTAVALGGLAAWALATRDTVAWAVMLSYVAFALDELALAGYAYLQGLERMGFQAVTVLTTQALRTAGGIALAVVTEDLLLVLGWLAVTGLVGVTATAIRLRRIPRPGPAVGPQPPFTAVMGSCGAMMLVVLFNAVILRADSVIIGIFDGARDVGLYTAAYALVAAVQILPWIASVVVYPVFARAFASDHRLLRTAWTDAVGAVLLMTVPAAVLAVLLGTRVIEAVYGAEFSRSGQVLGILMWWIPLAGIAALGTALLRSAGRERANATIIGVGAVGNVAANLLVVPRFGMVGAAWVTVMAELCMVSATLIVVFRGLHLGLPLRRILLATPALAALGAAAVALDDRPVVIALAAAVAAYAVAVVAARAVTVTELRRLLRALGPGASSPRRDRGDLQRLPASGGPA
ncbi:MAG: oligosaccharide flippase family protein [Thermoleophilia bacterium]|nr:oligosaccharide flippase family protein [Thermoleophilia bacterium]